MYHRLAAAAACRHLPKTRQPGTDRRGRLGAPAGAPGQHAGRHRPPSTLSSGTRPPSMREQVFDATFRRRRRAARHQETPEREAGYRPGDTSIDDQPPGRRLAAHLIRPDPQISATGRGATRTARTRRRGRSGGATRVVHPYRRSCAASGSTSARRAASRAQPGHPAARRSLAWPTRMPERPGPTLLERLRPSRVDALLESMSMLPGWPSPSTRAWRNSTRVAPVARIFSQASKICSSARGRGCTAQALSPRAAGRPRHDAVCRSRA